MYVDIRLGSGVRYLIGGDKGAKFGKIQVMTKAVERIMTKMKIIDFVFCTRPNVIISTIKYELFRNLNEKHQNTILLILTVS